ncbi:MAG TPA: hypothetical protein DD640_02990 [Clostridiales bacterium]|nr:hypothetical protein [Clostridiales bacterium]
MKQHARVTNLKCEYCNDLIGIDQAAPRFSWQIETAIKGFTQKVYRLLIASSTRLLDMNIGDFWDSGQVIANEQLGILYEGRPLLPMTRYGWKVMVWDDHDEASSWSPAAWFVTGVQKVHQWPGKFIRLFDGQVNFTRKEFDLASDSEIQEAWLFVAARGAKHNSSVCFVNGCRVGEDVYTPGATEYFKMLYRGYDVISLLRQGRNTVGLIFSQTVSLVLKIQFADGQQKVIFSDNSWKCAGQGPYVKLEYVDQAIHNGKAEEYDARLEYSGWNSNGYPDGNWVIPQLEDMWGITWGPLVLKHMSAGCIIDKKYAPVSVQVLEPGMVLFDFGVNMSGFPVLQASAPAGTVITIRLAEKLFPDGRAIDSDTLGMDHKPYLKYTFRGEGNESYQPSFMYTSFRYAEISGYPGVWRQENMKACFIHSDVAGKSEFSCSSADLNLLDQCIQRSFLSNLVNIPTDCPGRERRGWTADAFAVCEAEMIRFQMLPFYYRWLDDMMDCQRGNGWIPVELPLSTDVSIDVIWPAAAVLIPWECYVQYGDLNLLKKYWPMMKKYVDLLIEVSDEKHFLSESYLNYGDLAATERASRLYLGQCYFYRCAALISRIAATIGLPNDSDRYGKLASELRMSINQVYLHEVDGRAWYDNNTQSANAHALFIGLCDENKRKRVLDALVADIEEKQTNTTGFLGTMCLIPALADNGRPDVAYRMVGNPRPGGWLYLLKAFQATTLPESYDGHGSMNHAFLGGAPGAWFYKYLAGISPALPGYKEFTVKPYFAGDIEWVRARIDSPYGIIAAEWARQNGRIVVKVDVPANTAARVLLPGNKGRDDNQGFAAEKVLSGHYEWEIEEVP